MGQSAIFSPANTRFLARQPDGLHRFYVSIFSTDLGWFGLVGTEERIVRLSIGHVSADDVRRALRQNPGLDGDNPSMAGLPQQKKPMESPKSTRAKRAEFTTEASYEPFPETDWFGSLRLRLEQYARGGKIEFRDCQIELPPMTPFQKRVLSTARRIPYGQTMTYGQLALKAGAQRAARAVGNVMAANPAPIIIPCHRVVASGGKLGGYSAPQGTQLKERLLELEADDA